MASTLDFDYSEQEVKQLTTKLFIMHLQVIMGMSKQIEILDSISNAITQLNWLYKNKRGVKDMEKRLKRFYSELESIKY